MDREHHIVIIPTEGMLTRDVKELQPGIDEFHKLLKAGWRIINATATGNAVVYILRAPLAGADKQEPAA